ncbi:autophagy protein 5 [Mortierella sp. GBA43]|nr:autophagy protein 5 [Mortierella sp. GBA43]
MPPQPEKGRTPASAAASTSAPHNPIAKVIWDGSIPIQFTWDKAEAAAVGSDAVESFFFEAPRCSYFSLLTSHVRKHFVDMALHFIGDDAEVWYDFEGRGMNGSLLPWKVTVHFQNFPTDKLIKSQAIDSCQDYFMSMIKEADYLRNGSTKKVMNMSKSDQTQLWDGLWSNDYDRFWEMNHKLIMNDGAMAKSVPIRIYLPENCPIIQEPVSPIDEKIETGSPVASAMIHGIIPSLDMSAVWVSQNMSYPDNFLHLVIIINK